MQASLQGKVVQRLRHISAACSCNFFRCPEAKVRDSVPQASEAHEGTVGLNFNVCRDKRRGCDSGCVRRGTGPLAGGQPLRGPAVLSSASADFGGLLAC